MRRNFLNNKSFTVVFETESNKNDRIKKRHQGNVNYSYYSGFSDGYKKAVRDVTAVFAQHGVDLWGEQNYEYIKESKLQKQGS